MDGWIFEYWDDLPNADEISIMLESLSAVPCVHSPSAPRSVPTASVASMARSPRCGQKYTVTRKSHREYTHLEICTGPPPPPFWDSR
ncbi:hypothetical protein AAFF_G00402200 [Aldrovandia affinis]|uniref:Uncharacterized protein n=1 Tax=Aldrovandia affinis TaxID=143900 RepID=A0AAD7X0F6_9TELE|nr:hypothetical protein AAFF_G00402200 [Aldrovandia affinis]